MAFDPSSATAVDEQPRQFDPSTAALVEQPSLAQDIGKAAVGAVKGLIPHSVGDLIKMFTYTPLEDVGTQISEPFKIAAEAQKGTPLLEAAQRARPDIPITGTREQKLESVIGGALQAGIVGLGAKLPTLKETLFGKAERPFTEPSAPTAAEQATGEVINRATQERQVEESVPTERPRDDTGRTPATPSVSGGVRPTAEVAGEAPVAEPTGVSIPVMITKQMESDLRGRGFTQEQINSMRPEEAHKILTPEAGETPPSPAARITTAIQHEGQILEGKSPTEMHADIGEQHGIGEPPENERGFVVHEPDGSTRFLGREEGGKLADAEGLRSKEFEGKPLASEHLQGRAAEVEPPPTTPPGAPITTEEPSPQPKVGGVNAAALAERPIETPERGEVFSREEGVRLGNVWLDKGGDPQKIINHFNKTGEIGPTNMGRMTAALLRKQAATDFAKDALRDNPTDPALKTKVDAALADEQAFSDAYKPMHTVASANLRSLQGKQALTEEMAQSYSGLERAYQEQTGKQFTPEQSQRAAKLSEQSKGLNQEYKAGNENVLQTADREYSRIRAVKKTTTLDDLVAVLTEPLKEVC